MWWPFSAIGSAIRKTGERRERRIRARCLGHIVMAAHNASISLPLSKGDLYDRVTDSPGFFPGFLDELGKRPFTGLPDVEKLLRHPVVDDLIPIIKRLGAHSGRVQGYIGFFIQSQCYGIGSEVISSAPVPAGYYNTPIWEVGDPTYRERLSPYDEEVSRIRSELQEERTTDAQRALLEQHQLALKEPGECPRCEGTGKLSYEQPHPVSGEHHSDYTGEEVIKACMYCEGTKTDAWVYMRQIFEIQGQIGRSVSDEEVLEKLRQQGLRRPVEICPLYIRIDRQGLDRSV